MSSIIGAFLTLWCIMLGKDNRRFIRGTYDCKYSDCAVTTAGRLSLDTYIYAFRRYEFRGFFSLQLGGDERYSYSCRALSWKIGNCCWRALLAVCCVEYFIRAVCSPLLKAYFPGPLHVYRFSRASDIHVFSASVYPVGVSVR